MRRRYVGLALGCALLCPLLASARSKKPESPLHDQLRYAEQQIKQEQQTFSDFQSFVKKVSPLKTELQKVEFGASDGILNIRVTDEEDADNLAKELREKLSIKFEKHEEYTRYDVTWNTLTIHILNEDMPRHNY